MNDVFSMSYRASLCVHLQNVGGGTAVVQVRATDRDAGLNSVLSYYITRGNEDLTFRMDRVTGEIATRPSPPDRERQSSYCLLVTVEDEGNPSLSVSRWGAGLGAEHRDAAWGWIQEGVDAKFCGDALMVWPCVSVLLQVVLWSPSLAHVMPWTLSGCFEVFSKVPPHRCFQHMPSIVSHALCFIPPTLL